MQNHHTINTYKLSEEERKIREEAFIKNCRIDTGLLSENDREKYILGFGPEGGNFIGDTRIQSSYSKEKSDQRRLNRLKLSYHPYQKQGETEEKRQTEEQIRRESLLDETNLAIKSQLNTTSNDNFQQKSLSAKKESLLDLLKAAQVIETNAKSNQPSNTTIQTHSQSLGMPYSVVLSSGLASQI